MFSQSQDYDPYEENPGIAPFSEPETQIMRKLALSFDPHIWVNVHSGMEVTAYDVSPIIIFYSLVIPSFLFLFSFQFVYCPYSPHTHISPIASFFQALFMPYDHKNTTPDGVSSQRMTSLLEKLNLLHCHKGCMIGSGGGSVG